MLPQTAPLAAQLVFGVQLPLPFMCFLMLSKSTRPEVLFATSYASQLTDHVMTPRKFGWLAFMWSVWQCVFEVTQSYALLIVVVLMNGGFDDLGPEGTPN